ncbi:MAG: sensor histidine kinase, partial [Chloroflexi bacterium]|nr:sensor histidine kinase [Chloroflexota bacterium]
DIPHLFDKFYRSKRTAHQAEEGTGLGLAIVKSIIEQHDGRIDVHSAVGEGSSFIVTLPLVVPEL